MRRLVIGLAIACGVTLPLVAQFVRGAAAARVDVEPVREQRLAPSVLASGVFAYTSQVTLTPEVLGRVREIRAVEGQRVRAGELVVVLDAHDAEAQVAQFAAAENQARIELQRDQRELDYRNSRAQRYRELRAQGMVTAAQDEELAHDADAARLQLQGSHEAVLRASAELAQARQALAKTGIRSPIDGQVTAVETRVGETVVPSVSNVPGSALLAISNPSEMLAEVEVEETDVAALQIGQSARVFAAADPDKPLSATVRHVAVMPVQQQRGRVYKVRLLLADAAAASFRPGMGCRAEIFVGRPGRVVAVPQQAVLDADAGLRGRRPYVFVVVDGVARRREVGLGQSDDANVEITSGVSLSDSVVSGPPKDLRGLHDGDRIAPAATAASR